MPRKRRKIKNERLMAERSEHLYEETLENLDTDPREKYNELDAYLKAFRRYPTLTEYEDFIQLYNDWKGGRSEARDFLVYGNIRLVLSVALKHIGRGLPLLDMMQEGVIGLMRALDKFDPSFGTKFSTYAVWWIRQAISHALVDIGEHRPYRIPVHMQEKLNKVSKAIGIFFRKNCRFPEDDELLEEILNMAAEAAEATALLDGEEDKEEDEEGYDNVFTLDTVRKCRNLINEGCVSLQDKVIGSEDMLIEDLIQDPGTNPEAFVEAKRLLTEYEEAMGRIEAEIDKLDDRAATVLRLRFGLGELPPLGLEEIGQHFDVTRERIRQIEANALSKISGTLEISGDQIEQIANTIDELKKIVSL